MPEIKKNGNYDFWKQMAVYYLEVRGMVDQMREFFGEPETIEFIQEATAGMSIPLEEYNDFSASAKKSQSNKLRAKSDKAFSEMVKEQRDKNIRKEYDREENIMFLEDIYKDFDNLADKIRAFQNNLDKDGSLYWSINDIKTSLTGSVMRSIESLIRLLEID